MPSLLAALLLAATVAPATALGVADLLGGGRLIAYEPRVAALDVGALRADADDLHARGFTAVATYDARLPVCRIFKRRGFHTVLVGVRDPTDRGQLRAAVRQRRCADGYVIGNGGLLRGRYTRAQAEAAVARLRRATGRPVTIREPLRSYRRDPGLLTLGDWVFPTIRPFFGDRKHPQSSCGWVLARTRELARRVPGSRPFVFAEIGFPSAGQEGISENYQRAFFGCIESRSVPFGYWAAYDDPRPTEPAIDAHWGLFRADATPKMWAAVVAPPRVTLAVAGGVARGRIVGIAPRRVRVVVYALGEGWRRAGEVVPRGRAWTLPVGPANGWVALLVAPSYVAPESPARLPQVDGTAVLASSAS